MKHTAPRAFVIDPHALVTEINLHMLSIIALAARIDPVGTMSQYSINEDVVTSLSKLTAPQILRISNSPHFLFAVDERRLRAQLKDEVNGTGYGSMECIIQDERLSGGVS